MTSTLLRITAGLLVLVVGLILGVSYPEHKIVGVLIMFGGLYYAIYRIGYDN